MILSINPINNYITQPKQTRHEKFYQIIVIRNDDMLYYQPHYGITPDEYHYHSHCRGWHR